MKARKLLAVLLCMVMMMTVLAACGSSDSSDSDTAQETEAETEDAGTEEDNSDTGSGEKLSFTFWTLWDGTDSDFALAMVEAFEEEYNCDIEMVTMASADFYTKMATAGISGEGPDVATVHATAYINDFQEAGIITSLSEACDTYGVDINFSDYSTTVSGNVIIDDEYYALPLDTISRVVVYNTDMLEGTSVLDENGKLITPDTYEGWCEMMETIEDEMGDSIAAPIAFSPQNAQSVLNWLSFYEQATDVPFFTDREVTFDDEVAAAVLEDFAAFYQNYCLAGLSGTEDVDMFTAEEIPIIVTGTFNVGSIQNALGDKVSMTYFPQWYDEPAVTVNSHTLVLCNSDNRDDEVTTLCLEFIKWFGENGAMWAESGALPANQTVYSDEAFTSLPGREDLVDSLSIAKALPKTATGQMQAISEINTPVGSVMTGDMSGADAVAEIRKYCEESFAE